MEKGKKLFAIAFENFRTGQTGIFHTQAKSREDVYVAMIGVKASLPKGTRVVGVAEAVGVFEDDKGRLIT